MIENHSTSNIFSLFFLNNSEDVDFFLIYLFLDRSTANRRDVLQLISGYLPHSNIIIRICALV